MTTSTRDDYREVILGNSAPRSAVLPFKGKDVEFRHLTIDQMMSLNSLSNAERFARIIISSAHIPGTDELIFEEADFAVLTNLTYTPEISDIQEFFGRMFVGDEDEAKKN